MLGGSRGPLAESFKEGAKLVLADWVAANPKVHEWVGRLSKRSVQT